MWFLPATVFRRAEFTEIAAKRAMGVVCVPKLARRRTGGQFHKLYVAAGHPYAHAPPTP